MAPRAPDRQSPTARQSPQPRQSPPARPAVLAPRRPRRNPFMLQRENASLERAKQSSKYLEDAETYINNVIARGIVRGDQSRKCRLFYFFLILHTLLKLMHLYFLMQDRILIFIRP